MLTELRSHPSKANPEQGENAETTWDLLLCHQHFLCHLTSSPHLNPPICLVVHKDGKNSRPYVCTIHSQPLSSHPVQTLDVAADSLEDLTSWVNKVREATQNADARVSMYGGPQDWILSIGRFFADSFVIL